MKNLLNRIIAVLSRRTKRPGQYRVSNLTPPNVEQLKTRLLLTNQAPVNHIPVAIQTTSADTPLAFTAHRGNGISVTDPDALNLEIEVSFQAAHGVVTLVNRNIVSTGLSYSVGDGLEDTTTTFRGKLSDLNVALSWVSFTPDAGYVGSAATLTMTTDDLGNIGEGGPQTDTDVISITVNAHDNGFAPSPTWLTFPGALDPTFDGDGRKVLDVSTSLDYIDEMKLLPDGKIVAAGVVNQRIAVMRFNADLSLDPTFGTGGIYESNLGDNAAPGNMLVIDDQDRILVGGGYSSIGRLLRLLPNGALDTTFGTNGTVSTSSHSSFYGIDIQGDGRVVFATSGGVYRMDDDGSNLIRIISGNFRGVKVWDDGDILAVDSDFDVIRYSRDAVLEQTYSYTFGTTSTILALPDNRLLQVGYTADKDLLVSRHLATGELDTSFGTGGRTQLPVLSGDDIAYRATLQADGKILLVGYTDNGDNQDAAVARLTYDGLPDNTFTPHGESFASIDIAPDANDYGYSLIVLPDGKIVVGGRSENGIALARLYGDSDQSGAATNAAPVNDVPATVQTTSVNLPLAFTAHRGNGISVSDTDSDNLKIEVTLQSDHGTVTLVNRNLVEDALNYTLGDGLEDTTVTFRGKQADINVALSWVAFTPDANYTGSAAAITMTTNDLGNVGTGGPQSDTDVILITVNPHDNGFAPSPTWLTFPGALDPTFDGDGRKVLDVSTSLDYIDEMKLLPDGKIVAAGVVNQRIAVMRFNADLSLDPTFGTDGIYESNLGDNASPGNMLVIDNQDRILVGGGYSSIGRLLRLLPNGALDTTFGTNGTVSTSSHSSFYGIDIQGDGRVVFATSGGVYRMDDDGSNLIRIISGNFRGVKVWDDGDILAVDSDFDVIRYSRDAVLEQTYSYTFGTTSTILALPDNRLLQVGYTADKDLLVSRHLATGELDTSFGTGGRTQLPVLSGDDIAYRATLQADGKILLVGYTDNGDNQDAAVARLTYDGLPDNTFTPHGESFASIDIAPDANDYGYSLIVLPDGKIVVGGRSENGIALARLYGDSDQSGAATNAAPVNDVPATVQTTSVNLPLAFTAHRGNGISVSDTDSDNLKIEVTLQSDHGTVTLVNRNLVEDALNYTLGDGLEDTTVTFRGKQADINVALSWVAFTPDANYTGSAAAITMTTNDLGNVGTGGPQSDTDVILITVNPHDNGFAPSPTWLTFPGALDPTFDGDGRKVLDVSTSLDYIDEMKLLPDGKIVAAGVVNQRIAVMRFNADLSLDPTFGTDGIYESNLGDNASPGNMLVIDNQDRILVGGGYSSIGRLLRLLPNGALDTTFGTNGTVSTSSHSSFYGIDIQGDGRVVFATSGGVYRMDDDGSNLIRIISGNFRGVKVWDDGDILAVDSDFDVIRYSRDAVLEQTYSYTFGTTSTILALPDNRLLQVGYTADKDLLVSRHLATGELDTSFGTGGRTQLPVLSGDDIAYRATLQADGKILLVGYTDNGDNQDAAVARLTYDGLPDNTFTPHGESFASIDIAPDANDYGYSLIVLPDGKIVVGGRSENGIALARLYGDSDQSGAATNAAPVNDVPATVQTTSVNLPLAFTAHRGNGISVSDTDSDNLKIEVTLQAANGTVTLVNRNLVEDALNYTLGDGLEDTTVTFRGKQADINVALSWVSFTPDANYTGTAAAITMTTDDLGNVGTGGPQSDVDVISITVNPHDNGFAPSPTWLTFPGALDPTFDGDGRKVLDVSTSLDYIDEMKLLPDGKIVAAGVVNQRIAVMRFNADLSLDPTFGTGGIYESNLGDNAAPGNMLVIDDQDRILVGGGYSSIGRLLRLLPNGALDTTFGTNGTVSTSSHSSFYGIDIQGDGRVVFATSGGVYRMDDDGSNLIRIISGNFRGVKVWDDGDILAVDSDFDVIRYSRDAVLEQTYSYTFGTTSTILALPDNRLLQVGYTADKDLLVSRHLATGELDTSFGTGGRTQLPVLSGDDIAYRATLQTDGKILLVGYTDNGDNQDAAVARLTYDGSPDNTFTPHGESFASIDIAPEANDYGYDLLVLPDGKIVIGGRSDNGIALARLYGDSDQSGAATNAAPVNDVPATVQTTSVNLPLAFTAHRGNGISVSDADSDNLKIEVTLQAANGTVTLVNRNLVEDALNYTLGDGLEDTTVTFRGKQADINVALSWVSFTPDANYTGTAAAITMTTDDLGNVGTGGPQSDVDVISITVNPHDNGFAPSPTWLTFPGALDPTFDGDGRKVLDVSTSLDYIDEMKLLPDGKIVAAGVVNQRIAVMRFNADLSLDPTFGTGGIYESNLGDNAAPGNMLVIDDQDRILVGGGYSSIGRLLRLLPNGALDTTFGTNGTVSTSSHSSFYGIDIQGDGRVVFATSGGVYRMDDDGSNLIRIISGNFRGVKVWDDGDILAVDSDFDVIRYSRDAVLEQTYSYTFGTTSTILALPDNRLLQVGYTADKDLLVSRHLATGELDTSFGTGGRTQLPVLSGDDIAYRATLQTDGKICWSDTPTTGITRMPPSLG